MYFITDYAIIITSDFNNILERKRNILIYIPKGVCSRQIEIEIENGLITKLEILGGCNGNLQGITKLVLNRPAQETAELLNGTRCGNRPTSCPDQIAKAIRLCLAEQA